MNVKKKKGGSFKFSEARASSSYPPTVRRPGELVSKLRATEFAVYINIYIIPITLYTECVRTGGCCGKIRKKKNCEPENWLSESRNEP